MKARELNQNCTMRCVEDFRKIYISIILIFVLFWET